MGMLGVFVFITYTAFVSCYHHGTSREMKFWPDRPTYWWRFNYTTGGECSSVPYCPLPDRRNIFTPPLKRRFYYSPALNTTSFNEMSLSVLGTNSLSRVFEHSVGFTPLPLVSPVNVTLYYEALCPDCRDVFAKQIYPTYKKLSSSRILNLQLVPYGFTKEIKLGGKSYFHCQHGAAECLANKLESCAIRYSPKQHLIPFMHCVEYYGPTMVKAQICASVHQLPWQPIHNCVNGTEGDELQHKMAAKTNALQPPLTWVPWFTLNGYHSDDIQKGLSTNMLGYVCYYYTGIRPTACY